MDSVRILIVESSKEHFRWKKPVSNIRSMQLLDVAWACQALEKTEGRCSMQARRHSPLQQIDTNATAYVARRSRNKKSSVTECVGLWNDHHVADVTDVVAPWMHEAVVTQKRNSR